MFTYHQLCPLCDMDSYVQQVAAINTNINYMLPNSIEQLQITIQYILNPITLLITQPTDNHNHNYNNNIKFINQTLQSLYGCSNKKQQLPMYLQTNLLFGWDYLIYGIKYQHTNPELSINHFTYCNQILQITCQKAFDLSTYCGIKAALTSFIAEFIKFEKGIITSEETIKNSMIIDEATLQIQQHIHMYQLHQYTQAINILQDSLITCKELQSPAINNQFYIMQIQLTCMNNQFHHDQLFTKFYQEVLQETKCNDWVGKVLFANYQKTHQLWRTYFNNLNDIDKMKHLTSIVVLLSQEQLQSKQNLLNLLLLAKQLKQMRQYQMSFVFYSFFRKFHTILNLSQYMPLVYANLGKLSLYFGWIDDAITLYTSSLKKIDDLLKTRTKSDPSKLTSDSYLNKILSRLMVLTLCRGEKDKTVQICKRLINIQSSSLPYSVKIFTRFCYDIAAHKGIFKEWQKYANPQYFLKSTASFIMSQIAPQLHVPRNIQKMANMIEFKDKHPQEVFMAPESAPVQQSFLESFIEYVVPQGAKCCSQKMTISQHFRQQEFAPPRGNDYNVFYNTICFSIVLKGYTQQQKIPIMHEQLDVVECLLEQMNCSVYSTVVQLLQQCQLINGTEHYIMACIHTYICDFELASKYLDKFTAQINEQQRCAKNKDPYYFVLRNLANKLSGQIYFGLNNLSQANITYENQQSDYDLQYSHAVILYGQQQYKSAIQKLLQAAKSPYLFYPSLSMILSIKSKVEDNEKLDVFMSCQNHHELVNLVNTFECADNPVTMQGRNYSVESLPYYEPNDQQLETSELIQSKQVFDPWVDSLPKPKDSQLETSDLIQSKQVFVQSQICESINLSQSNDSIASTNSRPRSILISEQVIQLQKLQNQLAEWVPDLIDVRVFMQNILESLLVTEDMDWEEFQQKQQLIRKFEQQRVSLYQVDDKKYIIKTIEAISTKSNFDQQVRQILQEIVCLLQVKQLGCEYVQLLHLGSKFSRPYDKNRFIKFQLVFPYYEDTLQNHKDIDTIKQLIRAIQKLNDNSIYHRDIKESNVRYSDGHPVIIDFGITSFRYGYLGMCHGNGYSKGYVSKFKNQEQTELETDKEDIYSMGCLVYNLYSGEIPREIDLDVGEKFEDHNDLSSLTPNIQAFIRAATLNYMDRASFDELLQLL